MKGGQGTDDRFRNERFSVISEDKAQELRDILYTLPVGGNTLIKTLNKSDDILNDYTTGQEEYKKSLAINQYIEEHYAGAHDLFWDVFGSEKGLNDIYQRNEYKEIYNNIKVDENAAKTFALSHVRTQLEYEYFEKNIREQTKFLSSNNFAMSDIQSTINKYAKIRQEELSDGIKVSRIALDLKRIEVTKTYNTITELSKELQNYESDSMTDIAGILQKYNIRKILKLTMIL